MIELTIEPHPLLLATCFVTRFSRGLGDMPSPPELIAGLELNAQAPVQRSEEVRGDVRDLLRHGGYKPTGRGKPASEYLVKASENGKLGSINLAVDACNVTSLHSGLPISVVDLDLANGPFRLAIQPAQTSYVFNQSGQEIDVSGLLCLADAVGPCANAVKDSQRTKTHGETTATLSIVWGVQAHPAQSSAATQWYRAQLVAAGASIEEVAT